MKELIFTYLPFALEFLFTVIVVPVILHKFKTIDITKKVNKITESNQKLIKSLKEQNENLMKYNDALKLEVLERLIKVQGDIKEKQVEIDTVLETIKQKDAELEVLIRERKS